MVKNTYQYIILFNQIPVIPALYGTTRPFIACSISQTVLSVAPAPPFCVARGILASVTPMLDEIFLAGPGAAAAPRVQPLVRSAAAPAPRSRALLNLPGLCPLCGHDAPRKVLHTSAGSEEAYRCPVDGEVRYMNGAHVGLGLDGQMATPARLVGLLNPVTPMPVHRSGARPLIAVGA